MSEYKPINLDNAPFVVGHLRSERQDIYANYTADAIGEIEWLRARVKELEKLPVDADVRITRVVDAMGVFYGINDSDDAMWITNCAGDMQERFGADVREDWTYDRAISQFIKIVIFGDGILPDLEEESNAKA